MKCPYGQGDKDGNCVTGKCEFWVFDAEEERFDCQYDLLNEGAKL